MEWTDLTRGTAKLVGAIRGQGSSSSGGGVGAACLESRERVRIGGSSYLAASQASAHKRHIDGHLHTAEHEAGRPPSFRGCGIATGPNAGASGRWSALAGPSGAGGGQLKLDQMAPLI